MNDMTLVMLYASEVGLEKMQMQLLVALMNNSDRNAISGNAKGYYVEET